MTPEPFGDYSARHVSELEELDKKRDVALYEDMREEQSCDATLIRNTFDDMHAKAQIRAAEVEPAVAVATKKHRDDKQAAIEVFTKQRRDALQEYVVCCKREARARADTMQQKLCEADIKAEYWAVERNT